MNANGREYPWPMVQLGELLTYRATKSSRRWTEYKRCRRSASGRGVVLRGNVWAERSAGQDAQCRTLAAQFVFSARSTPETARFGVVPDRS